MKANPGGRLAIEDIVGRDTFVVRMWRVLERQSVVLTAERRMGKTHILWKMEAEPGGRLAVYSDLEGVRTAMEFASRVLASVEGFLSPKKKASNAARKLIGDLGGTDIAGVITFPNLERQPWKELLLSTLSDLTRHEDRAVLFFWDELPLMLQKIRDADGEEVAMEVLDVLRQVRQEHPSVRMVFTGSIGLHNVLTELREAGHANAATNDMKTMPVPPLDPADAESLAEKLLRGEGVSFEPGTPEALAAAVDHIAYYVHHVVDSIAESGAAATPDLVREVVRSRLIDPHNEWNMAHFRDRVDT